MAHDDNTLTSRADVSTDAPGRYAKQLVSHLGRRLEFALESDIYTATMDGAVAGVVVGDGVLTLLATACDQSGLERVEHVLGSHLERFGHRAELVVRWERQP